MYCVIPPTLMPQMGKFIDRKVKWWLSGARGWGGCGGEWEVPDNGTEFPSGETKVS